jgi:hypothetical protein
VRKAGRNKNGSKRRKKKATEDWIVTKENFGLNEEQFENVYRNVQPFIKRSRSDLNKIDVY